MIAEPFRVTLMVIDAFDELGIPYLIGGSLASALYGVPRTTLDADLVADIRPGHASKLVERLRQSFYISEEAARDAIARRTSFNLIHLDTMFKVDVFVRKLRAFDDSQFTRRRPVLVSQDPERIAFVASAEDMILAKLEWFLQGGEVSERQWRDVIGMMSAQAQNLDTSYLRHWAPLLGVAPLLERALAETGERE